MAGIGKTILSVKLDKFRISLNISFGDRYVMLYPFKRFSWSDQSLIPPAGNHRKSPMKESHSWWHLRKHRCLLVLDDVETILRNGDRICAITRDEGYVLKWGEEQHQSCLVVSGLEKPREIGLLESSTGFVRSLQLTVWDRKAAKKYCRKRFDWEQQWKSWFRLIVIHYVKDSCYNYSRFI